MAGMTTHVTWSIESHDGKCLYCGGDTVLICSPQHWSAYEDEEQAFPDGIELREEITGHYCDKCGKLTSLSLNT